MFAIIGFISSANLAVSLETGLGNAILMLVLFGLFGRLLDQATQHLTAQRPHEDDGKMIYEQFTPKSKPHPGQPLQPILHAPRAA
tara:strand:- start:110 stop:364 length:255 start_codon:yes stop_codon:yes gene_type:complete